MALNSVLFSAGVGLAGAGALAGAAAMSQTDGGNIGQGAAIGGAMGAAAIPAAALAGKGAFYGGLAGADAIAAAAPVVGKAALGAGGMVGLGAMNAGAGAAGALAGIGSSMVRWDMSTASMGIERGQTLLGKATRTGGVKLTGAFSGAKAGWDAGNSVLGKVGGAARGSVMNGSTVLVGGALLKGATEAVQSMNRNKMGTMDGQVTRATPRVPSYMNNGGASGDLVFAMNANRRG